MVLTDPIADMLTRIRNAGRARHQTVEMPASKIKTQIAELLKSEGYLNSVEQVGGQNVGKKYVAKTLRLSIRYRNAKQTMMSEIKRISRPGCRVYATVEEIANWKNPIQTTILSTSKGIMTGLQAKEANLGGEVILRIQ